ncbi:SCD domain-containing protein [Mycena chlorophos]|uniref:SCD domain-containing protein n=1 Tax=Mycena chlorophos TaxID=658473 RepID=A0A8H6TIK6_MYCCL|nr:SCD domain-containing protein [Mycena chlorophos]
MDAMSDAATPRRSLRERKPRPVQQQDSDDSDGAMPPPAPKGGKKRKRAAADDSDADANDDTDGGKRKTKRKNAKENKNSPAGKQAAPRKTVRRTKKGGDDAFDPKQAAKETNIKDDNPLYNAILNPAAALQSTAEDFLESLNETPNVALAELVNMVIRCCACNDTMDADKAVDYDGVVDRLDDITEVLKKDPTSGNYPLVSKLPLFKKFRKSLREFLERLIISAADLGSLYTSELMPTLQAWIIPMSTSQIRSFRHTATVIALELESALCLVAAKVEKEAELSARQREGEKKRKGGTATAKNDRGHDAKAAQLRKHREKLNDFLKDFIDGVFVHRYRDTDERIRADCTEALGVWFTKHPAYFLDMSYLRYIGWMVSDKATPVRLAALHALQRVYAQPAYAPQTHFFTERHKGRLFDMAARDVDSGVRVAVLGVLEAIGANELEEDEREKVALCVFDAEPRVRRAVGPFVRTCWEEAVEERLVGRTGSITDEERSRAGVKALSSVLVRWGTLLDESFEDDDEEGEERRPLRPKEPISLTQEERMSRAGIVVEALWNEVDAVSDWETILGVLLLDHSTADDESTGNSRKRKPNGKSASSSKSSEDGLVDEAWRLEEDEETVLIEVLVASIKYAKEFAKKGDEENLTNDITRALIKGLPRLLVKYQTDQNRLGNVLAIPPFMNLDLYLEMRMITAYESLWDDITKQFFAQSDPIVLSVAAQAIMYLFSATSLSNTNSKKILELEDELASTLRDVVSGRDEIDIAGFDEDEMIRLGAICMRISLLCGRRDLSAWIEEDEGGKQSSAWDIISALADRGKLGYKDEAFMITQALQILSTHLIWKVRQLRKEGEATTPESEKFREKLTEQRDSLLEKLEEYAVGTQSNTAILVSRTAFLCLINTHSLFAATGDMALLLDDEKQFRCAGYLQAEIERYAETLSEEVEDAEENESGNEDDDDDGAVQKKQKRKRKVMREVDLNSPAQLLNEFAFIDLIVTFIRAVRTGVLHIRHTAVLLSQYGRLGDTFDSFTKMIVDALREEGMEQDDGGEIIVTVVTQALQEAFGLVLDGIVEDESNVVQLAKALSQAFVLRGAHLAVLKRVDTQYVVQVQTTAVTWIAKKLGSLQTSKNKRGLLVGVTFFKALIPLLAGLQQKDAMKIKAHLDQALAQAKVDLSSSSAETREPLRAYEKRLAAIQKEKNQDGKGRKAKAAKADGGVTASEDETELSEVEKLVEDREPSPKPRPRPKRKPAEKKKKAVEQDDDDEGDQRMSDAEPETPKARPRPKASYGKAKAKATHVPPPDDPPSPIPSPTSNPALSASPQTPHRSQKRTRPMSDDEDEDEDQQQRQRQQTAEPDPNPDDAPQQPPPTPAGDVQMRRKRARH